MCGVVVNTNALVMCGSKILNTNALVLCGGKVLLVYRAGSNLGGVRYHVSNICTRFGIRNALEPIMAMNIYHIFVCLVCLSIDTAMHT